MGLYITSYNSIKPVNNFTDGDFEDGTVTSFQAAPGFEDRLDGLPAQIVSTIDVVHAFRAGSYSGYNRWRDVLRLVIHGLAHRLDLADDADFIELIQFSDCEGCIGPKTCAKLAKDFDKYQQNGMIDMASAVLGDYGWTFHSIYSDFERALRKTRGKGFIQFS